MPDTDSGITAVYEQQSHACTDKQSHSKRHKYSIFTFVFKHFVIPFEVPLFERLYVFECKHDERHTDNYVKNLKPNPNVVVGSLTVFNNVAKNTTYYGEQKSYYEWKF